MRGEPLPMETIVKEKQYTFKELEQDIFRLICQAGVVLTQEILKKKDQEIFEKADKTKYRSEGFRDTSIKTQYGSVPYSRRVYLTRMEDGRKVYVHLLDEELSMGKIGLVSENLAEKIADLATETPYRETALAVSSATGTSVSTQGAWNIMQRIGERINKEEEQDVTLMKAGNEKGEKAVPVLFEEMDGYGYVSRVRITKRSPCRKSRWQRHTTDGTPKAKS
jgi:hypothetical protein